MLLMESHRLLRPARSQAGEASGEGETRVIFEPVLFNSLNLYHLTFLEMIASKDDDMMIRCQRCQKAMVGKSEEETTVDGVVVDR